MDGFSMKQKSVDMGLRASTGGPELGAHYTRVTRTYDILTAIRRRSARDSLRFRNGLPYVQQGVTLERSRARFHRALVNGMARPSGGRQPSMNTYEKHERH